MSKAKIPSQEQQTGAKLLCLFRRNLSKLWLKTSECLLNVVCSTGWTGSVGKK